MADEAARAIDLPEAHRNQVIEIIRARLPDARVWVYGSRAKGGARRYSDLDLMLDDRGREIPWSVLGNLDEDFDESDLPIIVEMHDMAATDARFLERVRKDFLLLE
ncbi:MAG: nucleotidyltransferase domain-containing protein [Chloroflexota bacterium]|nr:nucleotidyltransferase domain-containing protein [Chloroflexota bacterium]MDE2961377.1 nucleotidyltransferase domain-containing protein [Chloroflexota bacterium]